MTEESYFKREEDRKWREKVDHEQVTLMTAHQVIDRRTDILEESVERLDAILRGDPSDMRSGILGRLEHMEDLVARLNAVIFMDSAGEKGLIEQFRKIQRGDTQSGYRWQLMIAIVGFAAATATAIFTNLDKIERFFSRSSKDPIHEMVEKAKRPKSRHRRSKVAPPPDEPDDSSD